MNIVRIPMLYKLLQILQAKFQLLGHIKYSMKLRNPQIAIYTMGQSTLSLFVSLSLVCVSTEKSVHNNPLIDLSTA